MPERQNVLVVPLHLDALYLRHDTSVLEPMADFSRLPYARRGPDANPDLAYLSEQILSRPFEDRGCHLRAGIHLHWALPDALHRGTSHGPLFTADLPHSHAAALNAQRLTPELKDAFARNGYALSPEAFVRVVRESARWIVQDPASHRSYTLREANHWETGGPALGSRYSLWHHKRLEVHGGHVTFPAVPNRWLVTRTHGGNVRKQWIVESDYLHAPGSAVELDAIAYPCNDAAHPEPFRYMGRAVPLDDWLSETARGAYLPKLTAIGYGDPTFAVFYPNCHSVFGFYDSEIATRTPADWGSVVYDLVGWYSDAGRDCIRSDAFAGALDATIRKYSLHEPSAVTDAEPGSRFDRLRFETLEKKYRWHVERKAEPAFPLRTVCFARITVACGKFDFSHPAKPNEKHEVRVAVGNTATEALSAYLARNLPHHGRFEQSQIEEQLEALHLGGRLEGRHLDIGPKFREARHEQGFTALSGGSQWILAPTPASKEHHQAAPGEPRLPPYEARFTELLGRLNTEQSACDRLEREVEFLQRQLFADWYKYMLCAYPPGDAIRDVPDMDDARHFIEVSVLGPLEARLRDLKSARTSHAAAHEALQDELRTYNYSIRSDATLPDLELKKVPAPRYWRPNEPVILIAGEAGKATVRHGEDGDLKCWLAPLGGDMIEPHPNALLDAAHQRLADDVAWGALRISEQQPWHPFLLEWQVDVHPLQGERGSDGRYGVNFIAGDYHLSVDGADLELEERGEQPRFAERAHRYSGRSILTPYAKSQLRVQLEAYLQKQLLPRYYEEKKIPLEKRNPADAAELLADVVAWYESARSRPIDQAEAKDEVTDFLFSAYRELVREENPRYWCIAQSLAGFNQALLMRKQTLQLPIDEPLGFDEDRRFTQRVREAVGTQNRSAPQPADGFLPIRAGELEIVALRLVDTFGRVKDLHVAEVVATDAMPVGPGGAVLLPPRITQPARLDFRWMPALTGSVSTGRGDASSGVHATGLICGWIVHNRFDRSLAIYSGEGEPLGSVIDKAQWRPAPGLRATASENIPNAALRRLVAQLLAADVASFMDRLERNLESVEPEHFAHHTGIAFLVARPLAVLRAKLCLELREPPAVNQAWDAFERAMDAEPGSAREHDGFTRVRFPVRIGDFGQLNDGLIAVWRDDDHGGPLVEVAYGPQRPAQVSLSIDGGELELTLLIDPRGVVHATSGILPVKSIGLPDEEYADALKRLQMTFRVGPVLMPGETVRVPLPIEPGYGWSWVDRENGSWRTVESIGPPIVAAQWEGPQEVREGWLRLARND